MRRLLTMLVGLVGMLAVGCGGGNGGVVPLVADWSCEMPDDMESYRFAVSVTIDVEGLEEAPEETAEAGGLLTGLVDIRAEGAFVAPDQYEARLEYGGMEVSGITIGDDEWIKRGASGWEEATAETGSVTFAGDLCEDFGLPEVSGLEASEETANGVATYHYHLDEAGISNLARFFAGGGRTGETEWVDVGGGGVLQEEGVLDLWLAKEGNWPVRMEGEFRLEDEEGTEVSVSFLMEVKDVNDPDIKIEPPRGSAFAPFSACK